MNHSSLFTWQADEGLYYLALSSKTVIPYNTVLSHRMTSEQSRCGAGTDKPRRCGHAARTPRSSTLSHGIICALPCLNQREERVNRGPLLLRAAAPDSNPIRVASARAVHTRTRVQDYDISWFRFGSTLLIVDCLIGLWQVYLFCYRRPDGKHR